MGEANRPKVLHGEMAVKIVWTLNHFVPDCKTFLAQSFKSLYENLVRETANRHV